MCVSVCQIGIGSNVCKKMFVDCINDHHYDEDGLRLYWDASKTY